MNEYEANNHREVVIDKIQIVHYLAGTGKLEVHSDPYKFQKLAFGCMMTKKGKFFHEGGFYVVDEKNEKIENEKALAVVF